MQQKKNTTLTTSTANGRAAHTIPTLMKRITVLFALIVSFALGARAAQYVFYYSGNYMYVDNNGQLASTTTFSTACIWEGTSGNKFYAVNSNGSTYYLRYNNGLTVTTNQNNATNWTVNGNNLYFQSGTSGSSYWPTSYYRSVRYNNGWGISNEEETNGWFDSPSFSSDCNVLYQVTTRTVESKTDTELTPASANVTLNPSTVELEKINDRAEFQATAPTITQKTYTIPEHKTYTFNNTTYYQSGSTISATEPAGNLTSSVVLNPTYHWDLSSGGNTYLDAGYDGGTGWVQKKANPNADTEVIVSVWAVYGDNAYTTPTTTATITVMSEKYNPTGITVEPLMLEVGGTGSITYILEPTGAKDEITYNGYDNTIISIDANGVVTGLKAGITEVTLTAKKLDNSDGPSTKVQVTVTPKAPTIEFSLGANITATISTTETGATIYYTTDGTTPTTSSPVYTAPVSVTAGATVKAIVVVTVNGTQLTSPVAEALANAESGIVGNTVFLYDLEDHNWTYYQSDSPISSPNPRNVKITYEGNGGAVGIDAPNQVNFVYYKTLESEGNNYPYTTIANPFSKRPSEGSGNSKTYKGFKAWRVKSITGGSITNYAVNSEIPAETDINFVFSGTYSTNCISAEIILEAVWTTAYVVRCSVGDINNNLNNATLRGSSYETNFIVVNSGNSSSTAINANTQKSVTITMVEPDGSEDYRNSSRYINPQTITLNNALKFEYINMNNNNTTINANAMNLVLGRGIANTTSGSVCANYIRGIGGNKTSSLNYQLRIESGIYNYLSFVAGRSEGGNNQGTKHSCSGTSNLVKGILGCDYDRSTTTNSLLKVQQEIIMGYYPTFAKGNENRETLRVIARSGDFTSAKNNDIADADESFYLSLGGDQTYVGRRTLIIEGGQFLSIAGGIDEENPSDALSVYIRMKGGIVRGAIYGSGAFAATSGHRKIVVTGGIVRGWIAAGCNGTSTTTSGGILPSDTYVYVGGNATVGYKDGTTIKINTSEGGNVFGAGSGNSSQAETGRVNNSTVVIADDAYIQKNVYGGGNYGYTRSTANVLISGGMINGRVFGGSNQKQGAMINLTTTGGEILGGVYGGSNVTGTISGDVTMQINGGQVGTSSKSANIHGGGYGQNTIVTGNVNLTLGTSGQTSEGVTVWGDVYGGSALGKVNCTVNSNNYQYTNNTETNVTLYKGAINGSLYGGALGGRNVGTHVYGPVIVKVYGGSVKKTSADGSGGVYGANNKDGAPQRSVTVDIYGTDPAPEENQYALHAVYGGGNQAPYTYGNGYPKVTVHNCDNSIEYVYGGGNAAAVAATDVTIYGGNVIGNVFGGGNGTVSAANVTGSTSTKIYGGTILNVYGGSNSQGTIGGDINLLVNSQAEEGNDLCLMNIVNVFGGGNQAASKAGNISIVCSGDKGYIENVYGGANQANITGDIDLYINGGNIGNVFGGNNESGEISGNITVTVGNAPNEDCGIFEIGNVYGGGNLAAYSNSNGYPIVNMQGGTVRKAIFGGGYGESATVTGNPQVNVSGGIVGSVVTNNDGTQTIFGDIYGGGNMAPLEGNPVVTLSNNANVWSRVFGGGNNALVKGKTNVTMSGGVVGYTEKVGEQDVVRGGDIFGGGNAATIEGETNVHITNGRIGHNVYGGGNEGDVTGKTNVKVGE